MSPPEFESHFMNEHLESKFEFRLCANEGKRRRNFGVLNIGSKTYARCAFIFNQTYLTFRSAVGKVLKPWCSPSRGSGKNMRATFFAVIYFDRRCLIIDRDAFRVKKADCLSQTKPSHAVPLCLKCTLILCSHLRLVLPGCRCKYEDII
jgi:hypothetical protein